MLGVGTQDNLDMAREFVASHGTESFPMLWDPSFETWMQLGVNGQPAGMLVDPNGSLVAQWRGGIPEEEVLEAAAQL